HIRNVYYPGLECDSSGERTSVRGNGMPFDVLFQLRRGTMTRRDAIEVALTKQDDILICLAKPRRRLGNSVQHRLQLEWRAADNFENIGGRRLLLQGLAQFATSRLDLVE